MRNKPPIIDIERISNAVTGSLHARKQSIVIATTAIWGIEVDPKM